MTAKEYLKSKRESLKLSFTSAAKIIGISQGFISDIERGYRYPSDEIIEKIAKAYSMKDEEKREFKLIIGLEKTNETVREEFARLTNENKELKAMLLKNKDNI